jgi:hypothetical protein
VVCGVGSVGGFVRWGGWGMCGGVADVGRWDGGADVWRMWWMVGGTDGADVWRNVYGSWDGGTVAGCGGCGGCGRAV